MIPDFVITYINSLSPTQVETFWAWLNNDPAAVQQIAQLVAKLRVEPLAPTPIRLERR